MSDMNCLRAIAAPSPSPIVADEVAKRTSSGVRPHALRIRLISIASSAPADPLNVCVSSMTIHFNSLLNSSLSWCLRSIYSSIEVFVRSILGFSFLMSSLVPISFLNKSSSLNVGEFTFSGVLPLYTANFNGFSLKLM